MQYTLDYTLDKADYTAFCTHYYSTSRNPKLPRFYAILLAFVTALWLLLTDHSAAIIAAGAILMLVTSFFIIRYAAAKSQAHQIKRAATKMDQAPPASKKGHLQFHDSHLLQITDQAEYKLPYTALTALISGAHAIYLHTSPTNAIILPHTAFHSTAQQDAFLAFLQSKLTP